MSSGGAVLAGGSSAHQMSKITVQGLGRDWLWPASDVECRKVVFGWSTDLDVAVTSCRQRRTAIQAGGNMGVWPWLLATKFARVITAEPEPECFACLDANVTDANVEKMQAAFGAVPGMVEINYMAGNLGAQWAMLDPRGVSPQIRIDDLGVTDCDLIYLDIEGGEMPALIGAQDTIAASKPVIVVEDKGLSERYGYAKGEAEHMLARHGYRVVARPHRDVVLVCG